MTLIKPIDGDLDDVCVAAAERLFEETIEAVSEIKDKIKRRELAALPELKTAVPNAVQATKLLLQEKGRVCELHKKRAGVAHDYAIDFDAARAEIGRRLACLREAGGD